MYGNERLPGVAVSETYRAKGSIWQGAPEATWFKTVSVNGSETGGTAISAGTIMKQIDDGSYTPIADTDIVSAVGDLPGVRLAIVADKSAKTGTTTTTGEGAEAVTETTPSSVLVGVCGKVDKAKLFVGETAFTELTDEQQRCLNLQLEAWGFLLVNVMQA